MDDLTTHIPSPDIEGNWSQTIKNLIEVLALVCPSSGMREKLEKIIHTELDFQAALQAEAIAIHVAEKKQEELKNNNVTPIKKK